MFSRAQIMSVPSLPVSECKSVYCVVLQVIEHGRRLFMLVNECSLIPVLGIAAMSWRRQCPNF